MNSQAWNSVPNSDAYQTELRSGDNLRDLYYQSPYIRRFTTNRLGLNSNEKDSGNKENISPLSGNVWLGSNMVRSTGISGETSTPSGFNYYSNHRPTNSAEFTLSLINSADSRGTEDEADSNMEEVKVPTVQEFDSETLADDNSDIMRSAVRLRSRPVLQERTDLERTPTTGTSVSKRIHFSKGNTGKKSEKKDFFPKHVFISLR